MGEEVGLRKNKKTIGLTRIGDTSSMDYTKKWRRFKSAQRLD